MRSRPFDGDSLTLPRRRRLGHSRLVLIALAAIVPIPNSARAQAGVALLPGPIYSAETLPMQAPQPVPIRTLDDLAGLSASQLEGLYRQGTPGTVPTGPVKGLALYPDARFPRAKSKMARVAWQGKVFDPDSGTATNRFFGVRVIKGSVYAGPSWLDGGPAMILDYQQTSRLYGHYRDEIRQIAPGLYLGLMYDRT